MRSWREANSSAALKVDPCRQLIPAVAHGLEQRRGGTVTELAAQPADQNVDRSIEHVAVAAAGEIEELVTRQHAPWPVEEGLEQIEFGAGQHDVGALRVDRKSTRLNSSHLGISYA